MITTEEFEPGHQDRITVLHINYDGTKLLTASIDHRVKVWDINRATGERTLLDTWAAHDADIRDAKWLHPTTGTHLATISNDLRLCIWQEDPYQAPNSGRRFKRIATIPSTPRVPFVSFDFKNVDNLYTYLAVIDRQGLLSVYEPSNPDEFKEWTIIDQLHVCDSPAKRGEQTSFKVRFDQNFTSLPYLCHFSDERKQLGLIVTAMKEVKIYRSVLTSDPGLNNEHHGSDTTNSKFMFFEVAKLPAHPALIRDVAWAPFNVRGTDMFATACKDGAVRIFELSLSAVNNEIGRRENKATSVNTQGLSNGAKAQPQSSLTTAIAGQNNTGAAGSVVSPTSTGVHIGPPRNTYRFQYDNKISTLANLEDAHNDAWSVSWDPHGQVLMSGGADGSTKVWRRSVMDRAKWLLFADQAVEVGTGSADEDSEASGEE